MYVYYAAVRAMLNQTNQEKNDGSRVGTCVICDYHGPEHGHICKVARIPNGFELHVDGKRYLTDVPIMRVIEIKMAVGRDPMYQTQQWHQVTNTWSALDDDNALDLRTSPHIYFVPPATYSY